MQRPVFFDPELSATFVSLGAVRVPLLSNDLLQQVQEGFAQLRPADGFDPRTQAGQSPNQADYHCTFLDTDMDYRHAVQSLIARLCGPAIDRLLDRYKILTANFYVKPPGTGRFEIHQNWPTCPRFDQTSVTVWIPLQDVDAGNGGIHIVAGSHKIVPDIATPFHPPFFEQFADALVSTHLKPVPMRAGEALVFCDSLLHWSPANHSASPRVAIQIELVPKEVSPVLFWFDRERPSDGFEVFEVAPSFFVERTISDLMQRPRFMQSKGHIANPNRSLTETQFLEAMAMGPATRARLYHGRGLDGRPTPQAEVDSRPDIYLPQA